MGHDGPILGWKKTQTSSKILTVSLSYLTDSFSIISSNISATCPTLTSSNLPSHYPQPCVWMYKFATAVCEPNLQTLGSPVHLSTPLEGTCSRHHRKDDPTSPPYHPDDQPPGDKRRMGQTSLDGVSTQEPCQWIRLARKPSVFICFRNAILGHSYAFFTFHRMGPELRQPFASECHVTMSLANMSSEKERLLSQCISWMDLWYPNIILKNSQISCSSSTFLIPMIPHETSSNCRGAASSAAKARRVACSATTGVATSNSGASPPAAASPQATTPSLQRAKADSVEASLATLQNVYQPWVKSWRLYCMMYHVVFVWSITYALLKAWPIAAGTKDYKWLRLSRLVFEFWVSILVVQDFEATHETMVLCFFVRVELLGKET